MKHDRAMTDQQMRWDATQRAIMAAIDASEGIAGGRRMIGEALCAALDTVGGGAPDYPMHADMRREAAFWADMATPQELEVYTAAALRRIERTGFAERARKRIFWDLWKGLSDADKAAFLAHVSEPP